MGEDMIFVILFFVYGLIVGSFCNVVIHRLHTGESMVMQRSHCPSCFKDISWRDNIPVLSYIILHGKCRFCKKNISLQYPFVEFFTAVTFASIGYFYAQGTIGNLVVAVVYALAFAHLAVIFVYDWKFMEIPMVAMWMAIVLLFGTNVLTDYYNHFSDGDIWSSITFTHFLSALVAFSFFFGLSYISNETWMGYGDAFIAIAIGLLLGPMGTFIALLIAFCVGAIYGIGLMLIKKRSSKTEIPFGPFLIFGLYAAFILQYTHPELFSLFV